MLEHFECNGELHHFAKLINDNTEIIVNFLTNYYNIETKEERELIGKIKDELRATKYFYLNAFNLANKTANIDMGKSYDFLQCPQCSVQLLTYGDGNKVTCFFCNYSDIPGNAADLYISNILGFNEYRVVKDGGRWPLEVCPECDSAALVDNGENSICFNCNEISNISIYTTCSCCNILIHDDEDCLDICISCLEYRINKF